MNGMISCKIDGTDVQVEKGTTILEAAQQSGIRIPTLCHHEALTPYGGCRLCMVEVTRGDTRQIVSSCAYAVEEGIKVKTATERIIKLRRFIVALLLAEAPEAKVLQDLAAELGAAKPARFAPRNELCIACGQCIRACSELVGVSAIDFAQRGYEKKAASPYFQRSEDCIGCGTCYAICPTGAITLRDIAEGEQFVQPDGSLVNGPARIIDNWKVNFEMKRCRECGEPFAPAFQLEYIQKKVKLAEDFFAVCVQCRP
jgi:predicted molibdopterin-dependent oxidoreductase YjgC